MSSGIAIGGGGELLVESSGRVLGGVGSAVATRFVIDGGGGAFFVLKGTSIGGVGVTGNVLTLKKNKQLSGVRIIFRKTEFWFF